MKTVSGNGFTLTVLDWNVHQSLKFGIAQIVEICQNSEKAKKENKSDSLYSLVKMVLRTLLRN